MLPLVQMGAAVAAEESMTNTDAEVARHDVIIGLLRIGVLLRLKYVDCASFYSVACACVCCFI